MAMEPPSPLVQRLPQLQPKVLLYVDARDPVEKGDLRCAGCERQLAEGIAFENDKDGQENGPIFCADCRETTLGPPCGNCCEPAAWPDALLAGDSWWHRWCLVCSESDCNAPLEDEYFVHDGKLLCEHHNMLRTAQLCGQCEKPVNEGIKALDRVWHKGCLKCAVTGKGITPGEFFWHDQRVLAASEQDKAAPPCAGCGAPALSERLYALGRLFHRKCFVCSHCRAEIGGRRFVEHDGEPYLEGCFHKLFGALAVSEMQAAMRGEVTQHAILVPLSLQKLGSEGFGGAQGIDRFREQHAAMLLPVRRAMRERGATGLHAFVFKQGLAKPFLSITIALPDSMDPAAMLPELLRDERVCYDWDQFIMSVHDTAASKGQAWWASATAAS